MGGLLTSISGQFAKLVVLGTMFPVLIISGLNLILVAPLLPFGPALQSRIMSIALGDTSWPVVALTFVVLVLTGLLYNLNIPIIRLYEGYPWERSRVGQLLASRWTKRLKRATSLRLAARHLGRALRQRDPSHPLLDPLAEEQTRLAELVNYGLPEHEDLVLPTKLGNVIRSFEGYPEIAYGMDAVALWPRLVAKLDSAFASTVDDAKTTFDFMLNCSFLSALTAGVVISLWLRDSSPLLTGGSLAWIWRITGTRSPTTSQTSS